MERLVDVSSIAVISTAITAVSVTVRRVIVCLERRGDRKLAREIFEQTRSTDALKGYTELRHAQQPIIAWVRRTSENESPPSSQITEG
jgi:hypothetical protein